MSGKHVGVANGEGLYLDTRQVTAGDCTGFEAGQRLLINRTVQAAVFESNARAILAEGLPYDRCSVGVVTDLDGAAELGDHYIRDLDDMAKVVRAQVDVVLADGAAVLNAADPAVAALAELCDGRVILYALDEHNDAMARHRGAGERIAFVRDGGIVLAEGAHETPLLELSKIKPSTGQHPATVLAAAAAAWALGLAPDLICAGLRTFDATPKKRLID
jgi:cyanophycin synthetase